MAPICHIFSLTVLPNGLDTISNQTSTGQYNGIKWADVQRVAIISIGIIRSMKATFNGHDGSVLIIDKKVHSTMNDGIGAAITLFF